MASSTESSLGSNSFMLPPTDLQPASLVLKSSTPTPLAGSLRNASGDLPPIPKDVSSAQKSGGKAEETPVVPTVQLKPINRPATSKNAIVYNAVQRRNPVLASIKNVGIEIGDIAADYQVGTHNGVLFLSLKYHRLHPEYIHQRLEKMKNMYNLRILLILCDVNEHQQSLRELSKIAIINHLTTFIAWSNEEVAQYLTTFKAYEHKGDETLKERVHQSYHEQLQHVLISGKKVNKTDADNLASQFGSFASITSQPSKVLSNVKGLAAVKVTSLVDAFNKPFLVGGLRRPGETTEQVKGNIVDPPILNTNKPETDEQDAIASPDWPSEPDEADVPLRPEPNEEEPSRSPGVSPELRDGRGGDGDTSRGVDAWHDPLDDEEEKEDGEDEMDGVDGENGSDGQDGPLAKRARIER